MDITRLSRAKQQLVAEALAAGFRSEHHEARVDLVRWSRHSKPRLMRGLRLYENGTGFDLTVDLSLAKTIRSAKAMRRVLDLTEEA